MENSIVGPSLPLRRGIISNLRAKIQGLANSSNGAAAVEFAFVVPIMLTLYFGAMELSQGIEVNKKAGRASGPARRSIFLSRLFAYFFVNEKSKKQ